MDAHRVTVVAKERVTVEGRKTARLVRAGAATRRRNMVGVWLRGNEEAYDWH